MNQYGTRAKAHWEQYRPQAVADLPDPETFFRQLGEQAAQQIDDLTDAILRSQTPDLSMTGAAYLEDLARRTTARRDAEEQVLRELILVPPEATHPEYDPDDDPQMDADRQGLAVMTTEWTPVREDPTSPFWQQNPPN